MAPQVRVAASYADYGPLILGLTWAEASIAILLLAGRFYTNWRITRRLKADFYIALFTFCVALIAQICLTPAVEYGLGQHMDTLDPDRAARALEYSWVFQIMFVACMALGKLAIIAFLLQIRGPHDPKPYALYFVGVTQTLVMIITMVFISQQCSPIARLWDSRVAGTCDGKLRNQRFGYFQGAWSALCDLTLALYPISIIWKVKVDLHVKIGLCVLMGLGVVAAICSAIRTAELETLSNTLDITYSLSPLIIWTATETWIILIVSCVPPIRPLFVQIFHAVSTATNTSRSRSRNSRSFSRNQPSRAGTALLTRSDKSDYPLKAIEETDDIICVRAPDEHRRESKLMAMDEVCLDDEDGHGEMKGQEVRITTKGDIEYGERNFRTSSSERDS